MSFFFFELDDAPSNGNAFDRTNPLSIYEYSRHLIGHSLRALYGDSAIAQRRKGKGGLGQMVEELFFGYGVNSNREADFREAGLELKCTPLLRNKKGGLRIKERMVCTMIDYFEITETDFNHSHLIAKCRLMLLLFYLHVYGKEIYDYEFLYRVLWELPEKDLLQIKQDYDTIANKVRQGNAHLLSEGDTLYLGACRKGQKGDALQNQPFSDIKAKKRAFSLKPAYMRHILEQVEKSGNTYFSNHDAKETQSYELVSKEDLKERTFEQIIKDRFKPYKGLDFLEICAKLGIEPYQSKSKYADVAALIASGGKSKRLAKSEEFIKSGIIMKTIRLCRNGMPRESMSFKNIDYQEIFDNDDWLESELYEIFTSRFMFVIFSPEKDKTITIHNNKTGEDNTELRYILENVFFWTMPTDDLELANEYWKDIKRNVMNNNIRSDAFWSISSHRSFHVRPKACNNLQKTINPNGGEADKYCYWFNAEYVKNIIEKNSGNV